MPHASDRENESGPFAGNEAFPVLEGQRNAKRPFTDKYIAGKYGA